MSVTHHGHTGGQQAFSHPAVAMETDYTESSPRFSPFSNDNTEKINVCLSHHISSLSRRSSFFFHVSKSQALSINRVVPIVP